MNPHPIVSTYLVKPRLVPPGLRWAGFRTSRIEIRRRHALTRMDILRKVLATLLLWCLGFGMVQYITGSHQVPGQEAFASLANSSQTQPTKPAQAAPIELARTGSQAQILAIGPTGQMLAPLPMFPAGSIPNRYGQGQCTQYVAGRRHVPGNWGNANTWYPRAASAGWSVGTVPAVGAVAWTPAGPLGHVALVEEISTDYNSVYISEMNTAGLGVRSYRWVPAASFKYIYAPGY